MELYQIADLIVAMECSGETMNKQGMPYRCDEMSLVDITIETDFEKLSKARETYPHVTPNEWEYIQTGFAFSKELLRYDGFCLHASAVAMQQKAILFSAPCGTGKSTHAGLWVEHFGEERVVIINDDKPALRFMGGKFYVYGTPWSGKHDINANIKVPLQAIVFITQAKKNCIRRLNNKEALQLLIYQSLRPNSDRTKMCRLLELLEELLNQISIYKMECTISTDAVKLVYDEIYKIQVT